MVEEEVINLKLNEEFVLDLTGMGNAGYSWVYEVTKGNVVIISHQYIVLPNPKPGDRGIERFTITGTNIGSCLIKFRQIQSWEENQQPLSIREFKVNVL